MRERKRQKMKDGVTDRKRRKERLRGRDKVQGCEMCFQYSHGSHSDDESRVSIGWSEL